MRLVEIVAKRTGMSISIHAPLTGCDGFLIEYYKQVKISIHAPLTGCDDAYLHQSFIQ